MRAQSGGIVIRLADVEDQEPWDDYVLGRPEGVAYQLFGWKRAVESAYGFECPYLIAQGDAGVLGILPLVHVRPPFSKGMLVSLPYCDLGGGLAESAEVSEALLRRALDLARDAGAGGVELRLGTEDRDDPESEPRKVRMVLDLPRDPDRLMASFSSKLRSQVRKPAKDGLVATLGGAELAGDFYAVFAENMRDLGSPVHSRKWISAVAAGYGVRAKIGIVYLPDGTPAAGGLVLCHRRVVSIPWASSLRRFNQLNPNMLLYWQFLQFAAAAGYDQFDFGRSTPGEGTYRFKEQWGARPRPLRWTRISDGRRARPAHGGGAVGRFRGIAERAFRRLPVRAATLLGASLRKYVSL